MAIEGACFVLVSTEIISEASHEITKTGGDDYFKALDHPKGGPRASGGFSMIYAPDGRPLCEPLGKGEEGIVTAVIDLDAINVAKHVSIASPDFCAYLLIADVWWSSCLTLWVSIRDLICLVFWWSQTLLLKSPTESSDCSEWDSLGTYSRWTLYIPW